MDSYEDDFDDEEFAGVSAIKTVGTKTYTPAVEMNKDLINCFRPSKVFKNTEKDKQFTSLCFDDKGDYLLTASEDETLQIFDCKRGEHHKQLYSKKYGVRLVRFTHSSGKVLHTSTKGGHDIRLLNLKDSNYIRYFHGHNNTVTTLQMSPRNDTFVSGATDDSVRFWDLRAARSQGEINITRSPLAAYDPNGLVTAIFLTVNDQKLILFYDLRYYDAGPYKTMVVTDPEQLLDTNKITSMVFTAQSHLVILGSASGEHLVLNGYTGETMAKLVMAGSGLDVDMSGEEIATDQDGHFVFSGSKSGTIYAWDISTFQNYAASHTDRQNFRELPFARVIPQKEYMGHTGPSRAVALNPRHAMLASAGSELSLWLPDLEELRKTQDF